MCKCVYVPASLNIDLALFVYLQQVGFMEATGVMGAARAEGATGATAG